MSELEDLRAKLAALAGEWERAEVSMGSNDTTGGTYGAAAAELREILAGGPCPSCERDLSYPGKPGHECYSRRSR